MQSHLSEESLWASGLAVRLRLLQANFADDDPATRRGFLAEEIQRALQGQVPEKRKAMLRALEEHFPAWQEPTAPPTRRDETKPAAPEPPEALLQRVVQLLPGLTPDQRAAFVAELNKVGLVPAARGGGSAPVELPEDLLKRLGLKPADALDAERVGRTLALLLDMTLTIDQFAWTMWRELAPKSMYKREGDLGRQCGSYLSGSHDVSTTQLAQSVERARKLIAGLTGAVARAAATYARDRARLFDPGSIEGDARAEKRALESLESACWRKYVQLCREYGADAVIEKGIKEAVAKATENLIAGRTVG